MTPAELDAVDDEVFAGMMRYIKREAEAIRKANREK
jgi:hypothetical protein